METARTVSAPSQPSIYELLTRRKKLFEALEAAKSELGLTNNEINRAGRELRDARNKIAGFTNAAKTDQRSGVQLEQAQAAVEAETKKLKTSETRASALKEEVARLEQEILDGRASMSAKDVHAYQQDVESARAEVERIQALINEQRTILSDAEARIPTRHDSTAKREDLAAEVALGQADENSLKELDAEIERQKKDRERLADEVRPIAERARQSIAGLMRRHGAAQNVLLRIEEDAPQIFFMFLMSIAEHEGEKYLAAAKLVQEAYSRLVVINSIIEKRKPSDAILNTSHSRTLLPTLHLARFNGSGYAVDPSVLFAVQHHDFNESRAQLLDDLKRLGITIMRS